MYRRHRGAAAVGALALTVALAWAAVVSGGDAPSPTDEHQLAGVLGSDDRGEPAPTTSSTSDQPSERASSDPSATSRPEPRAEPDPAIVARGVVTHIVDGDTLDVRTSQAEIRVRLAQVDAPESTSRIECFGDEATAALTDLAPPGTRVALRRPSAPYVDPYDRVLAELIRLPDRRSVSVELVRSGAAAFAADYASEDPVLADRLERAELRARRGSRGLWGACGGPHEPIGSAPATDGGEGTTGGGSIANDNPWGTSSCHPGYDPCVPPPEEIGDLDCAQITTVHPAGVTVDLAYGDPHGLDGDLDGHGCD